MGYFCDTYKDDDDDEWFIKRRQYDYQKDTSGRNPYNHRFLSLSYIKYFSIQIALRPKSNPVTYQQYLKLYSQQVVYKNIGARSGQQALKNLMNYISRNLKNQIDDGKEKVLLFDSNHKAIDEDDFNNHRLQFGSDFNGEQYRKNHAYMIDLLESKQKNKIKTNDIEFKIWRVGTHVKFRNNWAQDAVITEIHDNNIVRINYNTKDGEVSSCIDRKELSPQYTAENIKIFDHKKAKSPDKMLIASDDTKHSVNKGAILGFERKIPHDFHHLTFSFGGNDYDTEVGHSAFRDFLETSFKNRGFDFIYAHHTDTHNPHYHVICKGQSSLEKGKLFPVRQEDSFVIRKELNYHLSQNGIDRSVTRNCDNIFQKERLSLKEKPKLNLKQNDFSKDDAEKFLQNVCDQYYPMLNIEEQCWKKPAPQLIHKLELSLREAEAKEDVKVLVETSIEKSKNIDPFLHEVMMEHYKEKKNKNKEKEDEKIEKLLTNLEKAKGDIEHHEILHQLSSKQEQAKSYINNVIAYCTDRLKTKENSVTIEQPRLIEREQTQDNDKGMGR